MRFLQFLALFFFLFSILTYGQKKDSKYPDLIAESYYSGFFNVFDSLYGGQGINYPVRISPTKILGRNKERYFVSLPKNSYVILQFTDNEIIDVPGKNDLKIVEHGCCDEWANIFVSHDGRDFTFLGTVDDCGSGELDLASIGYKQSVRFVKVVGLDIKCASPGFDLVSVYPLPGANRDLYADISEVEEFFDNEKEERILILDNVYFDTDSYIIKTEGEKDLDKVAKKLLEHPQIQITITGHTDDVASDEYNVALSKNRAISVANYLIDKGIDISRTQVIGKGESDPLQTNETEEGRAINRRVEIRRNN